MKELERARWRCRRGMLELDIVLQRFMDKHYAELDKMELRQFEALLDLSDHDLWNMIALEKEAGNRSLQPVLRLLQTVLGTTGEQYGRLTQRNSRSGQR